MLVCLVLSVRNVCVAPAPFQRPYACTVPGCTYAFGRRDHLNRHLAKLHPGDGAAVPAPRKRRRAASVDGGPAGYPCTHEGCGQLFRKKAQLRVHSQVHTGVPAFACTWPDCDRSFCRAYKLAAHLKLHGA